MIHIEIDHNKVEQFRKDWPICTFVRSTRYATIFAMPTRVYEKNYKGRYNGGDIIPVNTTNYVKITGTLLGQPLKLFIKESQCNKVLEALAKKHGDTPQSLPILPFSVTMKRVRIARTHAKAIEPIVMRSLTWAGMAAA